MDDSAVMNLRLFYEMNSKYSQSNGTSYLNLWRLIKSAVMRLCLFCGMNSQSSQSNGTSYLNPWRLIKGEYARSIAGFSSRHYDIFKADQGATKNFSVNILQVEYDLFDDHPRIRGRFRRLFDDEPKKKLCYRYYGLKHAIHGTAVASLIADEQHGVAPGADLIFTGISKADLFCDEYDSKVEESKVEEKEFDALHPYDSLLPVLKKINENWEQTGLSAGDIVSISVQQSVKNCKGDYFHYPIDLNADIMDEINSLSDNRKLIVFIAAGNSRIDLRGDIFQDEDGNKFRYAKQHERSKAIKVGYTGSTSGSRHYSNFGHDVVDFFAPTGSINAACYTYDEDSKTTDLIETFSGSFGKSSAATPIVAAIAAKAQRLYKRQHEKPMTREELINFLKKHGTCPVVCSDDSENKKHVGLFPQGQAIEQL